ncbi:MAG TPA: flagellar hook-length control protein FliK [Polyangiaceae bacterium]|nr:flagellar hook-length control protein FliK [Polyangiaceae bacterium]
MNSGSGGASAGGLRGPSLPVDRDGVRHERDGEEAAALWVALAQQVTAVHTLPLGDKEPTTAWRPSAGDLTPAPGALAASADAPSEPSAVERMTLRVDGGALGELEVTLERKDGALQVVIGMENQQLVGSVLPDAAALKSALEGAGVNLQSLNVVPKTEVGTVLAQRRLSPTGQNAAGDSATQSDPEARKRTHKRLTLIG